jgi:ribosomal protein S18 acetylase RimI-like enzyme
MPDAAWIERTKGSTLGGDSAAFIAEAAAGWVGFVMSRLDYDDPTRAGMFRLWVDPASRAIGIGRALTESVIAWAGAKGARSLTLWVVAGNVAALRLYRRCGFSETGDSMPMPRTPERREIRMSREFAAPGEVDG